MSNLLVSESPLDVVRPLGPEFPVEPISGSTITSKDLEVMTSEVVSQLQQRKVLWSFLSSDSRKLKQLLWVQTLHLIHRIERFFDFFKVRAPTKRTFHPTALRKKKLLKRPLTFLSLFIFLIS